MTGPFNPEDFENVDGGYISQGIMVEIATVANAILAEKRACPRGGEHQPISKWTEFDGMLEANSIDWHCEKCGAKLQARWEAV